MPFIIAFIAFTITAGTTGNVWLSLAAFLCSLYALTDYRRKMQINDAINASLGRPPRIGFVRYLFLRVKNRRRA